jgi:two-component system chemotaxis response regulator CheB
MAAPVHLGTETMTMKVLIVDDSVTFRTAIKTALTSEKDIDIVGSAANGKIAVQKLQDTPADLVILDLEMPEMDGVETLQAFKEIGLKPNVIIFAAPTQSAYDKVRAALQAGADEFLAKPVTTAEEGGISAAIERIRMELLPRIRLLGARKSYGTIKEPSSGENSPPKSSKETPWSKIDLAAFKPEAIVIASSTGGPMALETLFEGLKPPVKVPIFVIQHMPPPFTKSLAERLQIITGLPAAEGILGEKAVPGKIYVAPANYHMSLIAGAPFPQIHLSSGPRVNFVIPAADPLFETASLVYGSKLMAFVLTGMGEDARSGSCSIKRRGGGVMIQDEATSVVWGMPGAVFEAKAFDAIAPLSLCGTTFRAMAKGS